MSGCLTLYSPDICRTTSSESEKIRTTRAPRPTAKRRAWISAWYSATLLVARPR